PLLMYLLNDLHEAVITSDDLCIMLKALISGTVRTRVCGGSLVSYVMSASIIKSIEKDKTQYISQFMYGLTSGHGTYVYPSDFLFSQCMITPTGSVKPATQKYILYNIEKFINPSQPNAISAGTIEHILPQTLSDEWKKYLSFHGDIDKVGELLNSIGNLTITECNSTLSNKSFDNKKDCYKDSAYSITKEICAIPSWTVNEIKKRGQKLVNIALQIWKSDKHVVPTNAKNKKTLYTDLSQFSRVRPASFSFLGEEVPCSSWTALGVGVVKILYALDDTIIKRLVDSPSLPVDGLLSYKADDKRQTSLIDDGIWLNQSKNPAGVLKQLKRLLQICSDEHPLVDELWFTVEESDDDLVQMR
ncbi:MAG: HNH endonuclease, partial [Alphaproteobacteria bacterium]|nr:HNH endonuclease [Alphaproteobacteria bacterium]